MSKTQPKKLALKITQASLNQTAFDFSALEGTLLYVEEINRVTLDITSKPPGTIEWE